MRWILFVVAAVAVIGLVVVVAGAMLPKMHSVSRTARMSWFPALCKISGLCTRPSVPTIKLTWIFTSGSTLSRMGFGVVSASGACVFSQRLLVVVWGTSANSESCTGNRQIFCSLACRDVPSIARDRTGVVAAVTAKGANSAVATIRPAANEIRRSRTCFAMPEETALVMRQSNSQRLRLAFLFFFNTIRESLQRQIADK